MSEIFQKNGVFFKVTHFPTGKWRLSCVAASYYATHVIIDPKYLDHNPQAYLELGEPLWENWLCVFSTSHGKGSKICGKMRNFYCHLHTRLKIQLIFVIIYCHLQDPFIYRDTFQNLWPWKCRSRSWCTTFAVAPFDGQNQHLQKSYLNIFC